ncbi:hypothetical protein GCM10009798_13990 [Nocardioides panacihumi]|uniref:Pyridoxamine 5'-phosphate oxidase putative domain-containing protein n=1 Tax=Nocardioides panacihumi TaxID=400774 RepID=A0ABN2QQK9_9ACTN
MIPTTPDRDLEALLHTVLPCAGHVLGRAEGFPPFATTLSIDGVVVLLAATGASNGSSPGVDPLDVLYDEARGDKEALRAVAIAAVIHTRSGDYVRVEVERSDAEPLIVLVPYRRAWLSKRVTFGTHVHFNGTSRIWLGGAKPTTAA